MREWDPIRIDDDNAKKNLGDKGPIFRDKGLVEKGVVRDGCPLPLLQSITIILFLKI